jgi:hypothetical protein
MAITVSRDNLRAYGAEIRAAAESARLAVSKCAAGDGLEMLRCMKFQQIGFEPLAGRVPLNLVEQINQTFTCLVSFAAARELFLLHPPVQELSMNIGNANGPDISGQFVDAGLTKQLSCEVFAAVDPDNNRKLSKDISRVRGSAADVKYVFFFAPTHSKRIGLLREDRGVKIYVVDPMV